METAIIHQRAKQPAKWIPYWLWTVTVEIIKIYLEGFCRADGSFKKTPAGKQGMPTDFASSRLFSCHFYPEMNQSSRLLKSLHNLQHSVRARTLMVRLCSLV